MRIRISATSNALEWYIDTLSKFNFNDFDKTVEINNLNDLFNLQKELDRNVIIHEDYDDESKTVLEIYDDYRE